MIWALLLGISLCLWFSYTVRRIARVSRGPRIPDRSKRALLLIDLQTVFWESDRYSDELKASVENTVTERATEFRKTGSPVIAIRQEWTDTSSKILSRLFMGGAAVAGSSGTEIAAPFAKCSDHEITKGVQDAFKSSELDALLEQLNVGHLEIAGLDGEHCVARTAEAALNRGYQVTLVHAGIASAHLGRAKKEMQRLRDLGAG